MNPLQTKTKHQVITIEDERIENIYNAIKYLEGINYNISKMHFKDVDRFLDEFNQIKSKYEKMKKDIEHYQKILDRQESIPDNYYEIEEKLKTYKKELQEKIGTDFEEIIKFLKGELNDFNVNEKTLKNFVIYLKPLIKEVLNL
ncbi:hypothetical protein Metig_0147 [Methanotorris igneus Kol 5]|uniref:Uncharacterized protein n=2 Tax=Methanotorris igneus TaxID=2189 RepID=F6BEX1_METIK|nr:hypothetical protein Metig_0147 [Methanotorris igneus Kol 5]